MIERGNFIAYDARDVLEDVRKQLTAERGAVARTAARPAMNKTKEER